MITNRGENLIADAVIVATGFDLFKSSRKEEYGYGIYDNVITSADLEKMFRKGEDCFSIMDQVPETVGIVHCVGSRDEKVRKSLLFKAVLCHSRQAGNRDQGTSS